MPQCAFKNCRNNPRNTSVADEISYFRFPSDPYFAVQWAKAVAHERQDVFKPLKNSVVCSVHFNATDIRGKMQRRRLRKTAVPKIKIEPLYLKKEWQDHKSAAYTHIQIQPQWQEREKEDQYSMVHHTKIEPRCEDEQQDLNPAKFVEVHMEVREDYPTAPTVKTEPPCEEEQQEDGPTIPNKQCTPSTGTEPLNFRYFEDHAASDRPDSPIAMLSGVIPVCETPREEFLMKKLMACRQIIDRKAKTIHNLHKVVNRLRKRNEALKSTVQLFKKNEKYNERVFAKMANDVFGNLPSLSNVHVDLGSDQCTDASRGPSE